MKRTAYNLLRDGKRVPEIKTVIRTRYGVMNAVWAQSAVIEARGIVRYQAAVLSYMIRLCEQKISGIRRKARHLHDPVKLHGCDLKLARLGARLAELRKQETDGSFPRVVFGKKRLLHQLAIANRRERRKELLTEWRLRRSRSFFAVGSADAKGNASARLSYHPSDDAFFLEMRNWPCGDFTLPLFVPGHSKELLKRVARTSLAFNRRKPRDATNMGLPYTVRVLRSLKGYQVMISFELEVPEVVWSGRIGGVDINPEGVACTVVSSDGNLVVSRFFGDRRLIAARGNKRKWVLEHFANKMLRWCRDTYQCNAVALEEMTFSGAYDSSKRNNFVLSNFMNRKMTNRIRLAALKMGMLSVQVSAAYTSMVATSKYGKKFGGFSRHQLAGFVVARRALGFGEVPVSHCMPRTWKERRMWNYCIESYGHQSQVQTSSCREPLEWKSVGNGNGAGLMAKLLTPPPAATSVKGLSHNHLAKGELDQFEATFNGRAGRVHPNGNTSRGDGARGHRVNPPHLDHGLSGPAAITVNAVASKLSTNQKISGRCENAGG